MSHREEQHDGCGQRMISPRQRGHSSGGHGVNCGCLKIRYVNLLAVLALAAVAGCMTIALQFMASGSIWTTHSSAFVDPDRMPRPPENQYGILLDDVSDTDRHGAARGRKPWVDSEYAKQAPPAKDDIGSPVVPAYGVKNLVDRRFMGQRTGRPLRSDEELYLPPPAKGPFGWGTDWTVGVSALHEGEDVIEPSWCVNAAQNQSFVEFVMNRRAPAKASPSHRVASCVRTKDSGRYLPEWVAYHWALGVDEFVVLDDQSADDTREVLEPFIRAGIVKFRQHRIAGKTDLDRVEPLNECLGEYREMQEAGEPSAPRWVVLIDTDEYLWVGDLVSSLADIIWTHSSTCCLKVNRVQHGSSGLRDAPRGLIIENFRRHADPANDALNGPPKIIVNLRPAQPELGTFKNLTSPHETKDCTSESAPVEELLIRHYSLTLEDYKKRRRRYWGGRTEQDMQDSFAKHEWNTFYSEDMLVWGCAVRHVLARAASGKNVLTGGILPGLSPHHPIAHGMRPIDPYGEQESARSSACITVLQSSPTVAGTDWGHDSQPSPWLQMFCGTRYVFVHSFDETGGQDVVRLLRAHAWVRTHTGDAAMTYGGAALTSTIPTSSEMQKTAGDAALKLCGCSNLDAPGCWRYCPGVQQRLLVSGTINRTRRQLLQDWTLRFRYQALPGKPLVLVERDSDFLVHAKQALFPHVSTSVLTVRHPLCTPLLARSNTDAALATALLEWFSVWQHVLAEQLPKTNGDVWVIKFEDMLAEEEDAASALWAAVGLPPISPFPPSEGSASEGGSPANEHAFLARGLARDERVGSRSVHTAPGALDGHEMPAAERSVGRKGHKPAEARGDGRRTARNLMPGDALSRASDAVRLSIVSATCRARVAKCAEGPACAAAMQRSAALLDFFGYGGPSEVLKGQRFLWGKEELSWLGKKVAAGKSSLTRPVLEDEFDSEEEESVILPQAYSIQAYTL